MSVYNIHGVEIASIDEISNIVGVSGGVTIYNLTNADLSRKTRFIYGEDTAYPFTQSTDRFITYTGFDLSVETGKYYRIKAVVPPQYANSAGMIVIPYTQTLLDAYTNHASADTLHNTRAYAGWQSLDQILTIESASTGEPCIGILLSFRQASDSPIIDDAFVINSISIEEVSEAGEGDVVRYDIGQNKTSAEKTQARNNINAAEKLYVTPQMFGAKGDGVTDDTVAFQSAINTGKTVYVPLRDGQVYVITDTLVISGFEQVIYGDVINTNWGFGVHIRFNASNKILFDFKSGMNGCANLSVYTEGSGNVAIRFKKDTDTTNIDGSVINCSFRNFDIPIDYYGRGLAAKRNVFFNARIAIRLTLTNDPRWDHDNPTLDELLQTYPEYNGRSLYVVDNRFHVTFERYLLVLSEDYTDGSTTIKQVLNGAIISGNMADIGRGGFEFRALIKGCVFSGNEFLMLSQDTFFDCQAGAYDCSIVNNTIRGLIDAANPRLSLYGKDCFVFNGLEYSSITGNVVENFKQRCIYCYGEGFNNNTVIGNVFKNYGIDTTVNQYQRTGIDVPNCENSVISNNIFETVSDFNGYMIRARDVGSNVWKRNVFNDNTCTKRSSAEILVPTTAGTEDNIIQGTA